jgi:hypothetical protein
MRRVLSILHQAWHRLARAVAVSRRHEAHRLVERIERRRADLLRRAAARIGSY